MMTRPDTRTMQNPRTFSADDFLAFGFSVVSKTDRHEDLHDVTQNVCHYIWQRPALVSVVSECRTHAHLKDAKNKIKSKQRMGSSFQLPD